MNDLISTPERPELRTYEQALQRILAAHQGQYVVIQGSALLQYFDDYAQALDWAYSNLALDSFFVKRVEPAELSTVHFTRDLA
ncbi:hypothetical protein [Hydrogenophaga sp.]|uniref:hypothetical protein n=1 Tax=Hydrogenophaga sp. TaxID=1904254 RepID=UPI003AF6C6AF